jgi:serine/threonine protein kinase
MPLEGLHLGHYRLLRLIGSGGMGEVYLAEDARIGQQVAIKVIRAEGIAYPGSESTKEAVRLFEREAKAIARLDHPNILPLYAFGEETLHDSQFTYLVMPYRKEGTLATWLRQRGSAVPLTPQEMAPLLQQAAEALQHAHAQHILHQDIKPSNFLIRLREDHPDRPDLLLSDFGIAKLTSATASASQSIRGTPTYMAPEQWDGHPVAASDQYALAIMVYELLVGRPPFVGNPGQVMRQHYMTPPPVPSLLNEQLSPAADAVLERALAKDPEERFPSVTAFARAFGEAVQSEGALRATIAISQAEAESGTTRSLTLPGGRLVSVTVPAGASNGTIIHLEGQGMPYYEGGPSGPLVLTIAISAEAGPPVLPQESTDPTVAMSLPNTELPTVEDTSMQSAHPEAPGDRMELEPTVLASHVSETASTVLATDATSLTTEAATPAHHTPLLAHVTRSSTPPAVRPETILATKSTKPSTLRLLVLVGLAGLVVVALASGIVWFTTHQASSAGSISEFPLAANSQPQGITAGPDGNLWFTEFNAVKIGRISPNGTVTEFPVPTANPGWITAGHDGNLWFTEYISNTSGRNHIGRITTSGNITEYPVPTINSDPNHITAGHDGNLWFTEINKIGRITTSGSITEFPLPTTHSAPNDITAGPDGNVWFTDTGDDKIGRISPNGTVTEFPIPANSAPIGITTGPDSNVWFTEQIYNNTEIIGSKIGRISPSGSITDFPLPTANRLADQITAGPDGNLWFTEDFANKIGRITTSGNITEFPLPTASCNSIGITTGPDSNVWFTEQIYKGSGNNFEIIGSKIGRITSGK